VGVVGAGEVGRLGRAQEAEAVGQDLQHAVGGHAFAMPGQHLQHGDDHVLLARAGDALGDAQLLGDLQQLVRRHALEVAQRVHRETLGNLRIGPRDEGLVAAVVARKAVAVAAIVATAAATATATLTAFAEALATVAPTAILVAAATLLVLAL